MLSCTGTDVDDVVGGVHRVLVVLHNDQRIAEVTQMTQGREQAIVVTLMQTNTWLIEDIKYPHQARADLRCKPNTLCLTARERRCGTRECQIVKSHIEEEMQACVNLLQDFHSNLLLTRTEVFFCLREKCIRFTYGKCREFSNVLSTNCDSKCLRFQPSPVACRTWCICHIIFVALAHLF